MKFEIDQKLFKKVHDALGKELSDFVSEHNVTIAGGAIRSIVCNQKISDFDFYFNSEESIRKFGEKFKDNLSFSSDNADSYLIGGKKIQVIKKEGFVGLNSEELVSKFDFTVCMAALYRDGLYSHPDFYKDNCARSLVFTGSDFPISSLVRANKYIAKKGYSISPENLVKIAMACHSLEILSAAQLFNQLIGIDIVYLQEKVAEITDENIGIKEGDNYHDKKHKMAKFISEFMANKDKFIQDESLNDE